MGFSVLSYWGHAGSVEVTSSNCPHGGCRQTRTLSRCTHFQGPSKYPGRTLAPCYKNRNPLDAHVTNVRPVKNLRRTSVWRRIPRRSASVELGFEVSMLRGNASLAVAACRRSNELRLFQRHGRVGRREGGRGAQLHRKIGGLVLFWVEHR